MDQMATWQSQLEDLCRQLGYPAPVYNIVSDRRGGRTAWSATVTVAGHNYAARYWYDGQFLNNAKEDAAEVAWMALSRYRPSPPPRQPPSATDSAPSLGEKDLETGLAAVLVASDVAMLREHASSRSAEWVALAVFLTVVGTYFGWTTLVHH